MDSSHSFSQIRSRGRMQLTDNSALRNLVLPESGWGSESHNEGKQKLAKRKYNGTGISWKERMKKRGDSQEFIDYILASKNKLN